MSRACAAIITSTCPTHDYSKFQMSRRGRGGSRTPQQSTAKHWCFTLNNPYDKDITPTSLLDAFREHVSYIVFQYEEGEETGTKHFQGYCELKKPKRRTFLSSVEPKARYSKRFGTVQEAAGYCKKDDTRLDGPWEEGTISVKASEQGKRNDLLPLYEAARAGQSLEEIASINPASYMRNHRAVQHVRQMRAFENPGIRNKLNVLLYYGAPRTGKTWKAYEDHPGLYAIPCGKDIWFDNYAGESAMLYDDFSGMCFRF